jgi:transcriptional regulator with XRE-family HTH domain
MNVSEFFGKKLRELRKLNNLSANQLAFYLDCSPSLIYNIERGLNRPQPELIVLVAQYFNVSTDYLLKEDSYNNEEKLIELGEKIDKINNLCMFCLMKMLTDHG